MNELTRLQRKLIPLNIVVIVISLVAALSLVFAPLLTIDVGAAAKAIIANIDLQPNQGGEEQGETSGQDVKELVNVLVDSIGDAKLSITTMALAKFAYSDDPAGFVTDSVVTVIQDKESELVSAVAVTYVNTVLQSDEVNETLQDANIDIGDLNVENVLEGFEEIFQAETPEETDAAISALIDEVQRQITTTDGEQIITEEIKEEIVEGFKSIYSDIQEAYAKENTDEPMTFESFICVGISMFMNGQLNFDNLNGGGQNSGAAVYAKTASAPYAEQPGDPNENTGNGQGGNGDGKIYTNYSDLISGVMSSDQSGQNTEQQLRDTVNTYVPYLKYVSLGLFVFAGIWVIQAIFALLHLFLRNKRFLTWYTKLLGFIPCLLFGIAPLVAKPIVAAFMPADVSAMVLAVLNTVSSMVWISGACYLVLWLVSIFWAFPIKRRIRKGLKDGMSYDDPPQSSDQTPDGEIPAQA